MSFAIVCRRCEKTETVADLKIPKRWTTITAETATGDAREFDKLWWHLCPSCTMDVTRVITQKPEIPAIGPGD